MAQPKPRIRKAFPSTADEKESKQPEKTGAHRRVSGSLRNNPITRLLRPVFGLIIRVLRWIAPSYFTNSWRELKLVTWPNRRETIRLTLAVFIFAIVFGSLVAVVDKGLDKIFKDVILR